MAFAATRKHETVMGNMRALFGQYTQVSGDTGGDVATGLQELIYFDATGATKWTNSSGTVTITTANPGANQTGFWMALGY